MLRSIIFENAGSCVQIYKRTFNLWYEIKTTLSCAVANALCLRFNLLEMIISLLQRWPHHTVEIGAHIRLSSSK